MKLVFLTVSHKAPLWLSEISTDYKKKLSYWFKTEILFLKPSALSRDSSEKKKAAESNALLDKIKSDDFVIVCDEKGKSFDSKSFSQKLDKIMASGKKRLIVIVGGAYGVETSLLERADLKLSLSTLVMNHQIALTVILEQVYRAMTLIKGIQYHND